jgi:hypothetical protein
MILLLRWGKLIKATLRNVKSILPIPYQSLWDLWSVKLHCGRIFSEYLCFPPNLVAVRSKAWIFGRSLARVAGSNPAGGCVCFVSVVCQVEVSKTDHSPQRSPTECGVYEGVHEGVYE